MQLETMTPNPVWDAESHAGTVETLAALGDEYRFLVWGDDGCKDCRAQLPNFAATLDAAGIPEERVTQYAVERLLEGRKRGPRVEEYGIGLIPTVVIERDGEEIARFVEEEPLPIADFLAERLRELEQTA